MPIIIGLICLFPLLIGVVVQYLVLWNCRNNTGGGCTLAYMDVGRSIAADADSFYSNAAGSFLFCGAVSGAQTI